MRLRALWSVANDLRPFYDEEAVEDWMDANQLGRRNLTPDQRSIMRGGNRGQCAFHFIFVLRDFVWSD